jgi:O-succinylbenzoic acid--CoA ligase
MQVSAVLQHSDGNHKLNNIQTLIVGGGEISSDLAVKILQLTNNTWNTYGMTETITHVALKKLNGTGRADCFEALPEVGFEQDDRDCLIIHAPYLSKNPIQTNDIVHLISNIKFVFLGRYDDMINTGGIKVSPEKVEKKLQSYIAERIVISSIPDDVLGQKVVLIVEGQQNENSDVEVNFSKANLSKFESPKSVFYLDKFPETVNGKVNRKKLAEIVNSST